MIFLFCTLPFIVLSPFYFCCFIQPGRCLIIYRFDIFPTEHFIFLLLSDERGLSALIPWPMCAIHRHTSLVTGSMLCEGQWWEKKNNKQLNNAKFIYWKGHCISFSLDIRATTDGTSSCFLPSTMVTSWKALLWSLLPVSPLLPWTNTWQKIMMWKSLHMGFWTMCRDCKTVLCFSLELTTGSS